MAVPQITQKDEGKKAKSEHEYLSGRPCTEMLGGSLVALLGSCPLRELLGHGPLQSASTACRSTQVFS